ARAVHGCADGRRRRRPCGGRGRVHRRTALRHASHPGVPCRRRPRPLRARRERAARRRMIRLVVLDIDGVLTTGEVLLDEEGRESKSLWFRDIDAIYEARRRGLRVALLSGEHTPMVDVVARKLEIADVY